MGKKEIRALVMLILFIALIVVAVIVYKSKLAAKLPEMTTAAKVMEVLKDPTSKVLKVVKLSVGKTTYYEIRVEKGGDELTFNLPPGEYEDKKLQAELNNRGFEKPGEKPKEEAGEKPKGKAAP